MHRKNKISIVLILGLICTGPLGANPGRLTIMLLSMHNLLADMPKVLASPHDTQAVAAQIEHIVHHAHTLKGIHQAFMSATTLEVLRVAPPAQLMQALELASKVADRAELYNVCIPGLIHQRPFSQFPTVMRHAMRNAGVWEDCIQEHLPYEH